MSESPRQSLLGRMRGLSTGSNGSSPSSSPRPVRSASELRTPTKKSGEPSTLDGLTSVPGTPGQPSTKPLPGEPGNLSAAQEQALQDVKLRLAAGGTMDKLPIFLQTDHALCRFLRARNFDLEKSHAMLVNHLKWREEIKLDEEWDKWQLSDSEELQKYWPQYYHGTDRQGRPLYVQAPGDMDTAGLLKVFPMQRLKIALALASECVVRVRLPAATAAASIHIESSSVVLDLRNISFSTFWSMRGDLLSIINQLQDNCAFSDAHADRRSRAVATDHRDQRARLGVLSLELRQTDPIRGHGQ